MRSDYTPVIRRAGDWWIGWIAEVPGVSCHERSRDELIESLETVLREALRFAGGDERNDG